MLYRADNIALDTTTTFNAGVAFTAATVSVALQLQIPDNMAINIVELGWSQDVATATATELKLSTTDTGSTPSQFMTSANAKPVLNNSASASRLTYAGTGATSGYGNGTVTSRSEVRTVHGLYVPQQYVYQWALGTYPVVNNASTESYLQLLIKTTSNVNGVAWLIWDEA